MQRALLDFALAAQQHPGCIAVLYFTGHGFEDDDRQQYLVPRTSAASLWRSVSEHRLHEFTAGQDSTIVLLLDCCRSNENNETYKGGGGPRWRHDMFAQLRNPRFTAQYLVACACQSGTAARSQVGTAAMSPFTDALVPSLRDGLPLQAALDRATRIVLRQTRREQRPVYRASLERDDGIGAPHDALQLVL